MAMPNSRGVCSGPAGLYLLPLASACLGAPHATWPILRRRWRFSAVDPHAQLEQAGDRLSRLAGLTLPGEWAIGWAASASSSSSSIRHTAPSATPLARLLLCLSGRAGTRAPAVRVSLPVPSGRAEAFVDARVRARVKRICAAAGRAGWSAGLPPVELVACLPQSPAYRSYRSYAAWDGWLGGSGQP